MAKVDLSGVKNFFFEKGEKLGMFACLAAALGLVAFGIIGGLGAKTVPNSRDTYAEAINRETEKMKASLAAGQPVAPLEKKNWGAEWALAKSDFAQGNLFQITDTVNDKRRLPRGLGIRNDPDKKQIQLNYIAGTAMVYDINANPKVKTATVIKTDNPNLKVPGGPKGFQMRPPVGAAGQGAGLTPVIALRETRMVVVDAVFPLSDQLEEFRRALRMSHVAELFDKRDLPRFLGLRVHKIEMTPGQPDVQSWLLDYDHKTEKVEVAAPLQNLLREAIFDDQLAGALFAFQGLVMPQPKMSTPLLPPNDFTYPKADLEGLDWENNFGGGAPGAGPGQGFRQGMRIAPGGVRPGAAMQAPRMAGAAGADVELESKPWSKLTLDLQEKFSDKFYPIDPAGIFPDPDEGKVATGTQPIPPRQPGPTTSIYQGLSPHSATSKWAGYPAPPLPPHLAGVNNPGGIGIRQLPGPRPGAIDPALQKPFEALVRFIDVGVKPGSTYKYAVQVRIANPNWGKKTEVDDKRIADMPELPPGPFVETPSITIPMEYHLYAIDEKPWNTKIVNGSDDKDPKSDQVAVQIHRWAERTVDRDTNAEYVLGDWVIAERLLLRRGDPIGRTVNIEIPVWNKKIENYELVFANVGGAAPAKNGLQPPPKNLGKVPLPPKKGVGGAELGEVGGVPVTFAETTPPAILVDFEGGRIRQPNLSDESAVELLILNADGKLVVRNSRADSDPNEPESKDRKKRIEEWKAKVEPYRVDANPAMNANPQPNNNFLPQRKN
jgi:hypothetical protein